MASEKDRKRISEKPLWDQFKDAFTPFKQGEEAQAAGSSNQNMPADLEAVRRRRMQLNNK